MILCTEADLLAHGHAILANEPSDSPHNPLMMNVIFSEEAWGEVAACKMR